MNGTWMRVGGNGVVSEIPGRVGEKVRVLPTHVVLKIKRNSEGFPVRFKARIVVGRNL